MPLPQSSHSHDATHLIVIQIYLRLSWNIAPVTVCTRHKVELVSSCPHCHRTNIRNRASTVVPGYCTHCGGFLGNSPTKPATPATLWIARQAGQMLANTPEVAEDGVSALLETAIEKMAAGNVASFAKSLGLSKSGVWHWINKGGKPTLQAWLAIALHGGIGLEKLLAGDIVDWVLPVEPIQIPMPLMSSPRKGIKARTLDWDEIRTALCEFLDASAPITLGEACQRVGVDYKQLYQHANREARAIADRYRRYRAIAREDRQERLQQHMGELFQERLEAGYEGMSAREVLPRLSTELKSLRNIYRNIAKVVAAND